MRRFFAPPTGRDTRSERQGGQRISLLNTAIRLHRNLSSPEILHDHRQNGDKNNGDSDHGEIIPDEGDIAEEEAAVSKKGDPHNAAGNIKQTEPCKSHTAHTGYKGGDCSDNRNKAGNNHS